MAANIILSYEFPVVTYVDACLTNHSLAILQMCYSPNVLLLLDYTLHNKDPQIHVEKPLLQGPSC